MNRPPTFRAWLRAHRRDNTRLGDAAREIAADREFPREPLTAEKIATWCGLVGASTSYTECVLDAFAAYRAAVAA